MSNIFIQSWEHKKIPEKLRQLIPDIPEGYNLAFVPFNSIIRYEIRANDARMFQSSREILDSKFTIKNGYFIVAKELEIKLG